MMISGFENKDFRNGFDEGYQQGRADERKEWEISASELLIKYSGDIYEALPDIVEEIQTKAYQQGRTDAFEEVKKIAIVEIDLLKEQKND